MNKPKAKLTLVKSNKNSKAKSVSLYPEKTDQPEEKSDKTLEQLATVDFWKREINNMKAGSFRSTSEATEKLIEQVIVRLDLKDDGEAEVKEFLRLVFESSEVLQETLKKVLKLDK